MPVQAKFQADFSSFLRAVDAADVKLADFNQGADRVGTTLNRMVDNFSGRKLIQEAVLMATAIDEAGGKATLTAAELEKAGSKAAEAAEKMRALGYEVPQRLNDLAAAAQHAGESSHSLFATIAGGVASGELLAHAFEKLGDIAVEAFVKAAEAIPELVAHTIEVGSALGDLSLKTGGSVETLSALRYVASQTGVDFNSFGDVLFKLQKTLGSTGESADAVKKTLGRLGLDLQTLKNEKPDQAFIDIMAALEGIPNRADQAAIGAALFGKQFKDMAGLTQESIGELIDEAGRLGLVMSTDMAAAAHVADDAINQLKMQVEAVGLKIGAAFLPSLITASRLLSEGFRESLERSGVSAADFEKMLGDASVGIVQAFVDVMKATAWTGDQLAQFFAGDFLESLALLDTIGRVGQALSKVGLTLATLAHDTTSVAMFGALGASFSDLSSRAEKSAAAIITVAQPLHLLATTAQEAADHMKAGWEDALKKTQDDINHFADTSHKAYGGVGEDVVGAANEHDKLIKKLEELDAKLQPAAGHFVLLHDQVIAFGSAAEKLVEEAHAMGVEIPASVAQIANAFNRAEVDKIMQKVTTKWTDDLIRFNASEERLLQRSADVMGQFILKGWLDNAQLARDAWTNAQDDIDKATLSSVDYQLLQISRWQDDAEGRIDYTKTNWIEAYQAIGAEADARIGAIIAKNDPLIQAWRGMNDDMRQEWAHTWEKALDGQGSFLDAIMSPWTELQNRWKHVLAAMLADWENQLLAQLGFNFPTGPAGQTGQAGQGSGAGGYGAMLGSFFNRGGGTPGYSSAGGFDDGGNWVPSTEGGGSAGAGSGWSWNGRGGGYAMMGAGAGAGMVAQMTSNPESTGGYVLNGAATGASMGAAAGPYGMAAGAAAGAIVGWIASMKEWRKVTADLQRDYANIHISEDLAKAIDDIEDQTGLQRAQATLSQLDKIIAEAGGLNPGNLSMFTGHLHDAFSYLEQGSMSVAQVTQILDKNFAEFAKAGTDSFGRLSSSIKEIINLNEAFGTQSQAVTQYLQQQAATAAGAFGAVAGAILDDTTMKAFDELKHRTQDATLSGRDLMQAYRDQHDAAVAASGGLADLGVQAIASFGAMRAAGVDEATALHNIHPALERLQHAYTDLGLNIDDAGLQELMLRDRIMSVNPQLVSAIGALGGEMAALDNMGVMNVNTFGAMERSGQTMYDRLFASVQDLMGANVAFDDVNRETLLQMQDYLHQAQIEATNLGVPLDENTQRMIDQSTQLGIWHDAGASASDRMTDGINTLVDRMNDLIDALTGVQRRTNDTANTIVNRAHDMVGAFRDVGDEVDRVSFGHSPGGIKEIPIQLVIANAAMQMFNAQSATSLGSVYGGIDTVIGGLSTMTQLASAGLQAVGNYNDGRSRNLNLLGDARALPVAGGSGNLGNDGRAVQLDMLNQAQLQAMAAAALQSAGFPVNDATMAALSAASGWNGTSMSLAAATAFLNSDAARIAVNRALNAAQGPGTLGNLGGDARTNQVIDLSGDTRMVARAFAKGGMVYADMGKIIPFLSRGTDTVPAMLTPGEAVLNTRATATLGADTISAINRGAGLGTDMSGVEGEIQLLRSEIRNLHQLLPRAIRDAMLLVRDTRNRAA